MARARPSTAERGKYRGRAMARSGESEPPEARPNIPTGTASPSPSRLPPPPPPASPPSAARDTRTPRGSAAPAWKGLETTDAARAPQGEGSFFDRPGAVPETRRDAWWWVAFAAAGFLIGQIVATIAIDIAAAAAGKSSDITAISKEAVPPEWYVVASLIGLWVGFGGGPWLASKIRGTGRFIADLGLRFKPIDVVGVAIGVGGQVLVAALYAPFITHLKNFNAPTQKLTGSAHGWGFALIAVLTVVAAPFLEELFFRGLLLRGLLRLFAPLSPGPTTARAVAVVLAVVVDGLLFGLAHGEWEQFAGLALFGMALAFVSYRTGRLGMNMVSHASFNLVAIIALLQGGGVIH